MTSQAENEVYVKSQLRERMSKAKQVIVLIGENTKSLRKFVQWEIELAKDKDLPIIAVNLKKDQRQKDFDLCQTGLQNHCAIHVEFKMKIIQYALDGWPSAYRMFPPEIKAQGPRIYSDSVYKELGL
jgi:hypothetical protein